MNDTWTSLNISLLAMTDNFIILQKQYFPNTKRVTKTVTRLSKTLYGVHGTVKTDI